MIEQTCQTLLSQLSEYIDGELEETFCAEIEHHLATCENCRIVVNTLEKTVTLYRQLPVAKLPVEKQDRLFKVLNLDHYRRGAVAD
jgi:anti-sigma factor RsiW